MVEFKMARHQGATSEHVLCDLQPRRNAGAGPFSTQLSGPQFFGRISASLTQQVSQWIQALRSLLEIRPNSSRTLASHTGYTTLATLMRQLAVILTVLTVATFQTYAGSIDWLFDAGDNDDTARGEAKFLVWDGVSHPLSASFEKVNIVEKDWPFYLFHIVITSPGAGVERDRSSYLVCFKLTERATEFRIIPVIQYASDPPTENEIRIDKRLNRWPVSPPWKAGDDLPHNIKPPGLSLVLDECRAGSE